MSLRAARDLVAVAVALTVCWGGAKIFQTVYIDETLGYHPSPFDVESIHDPSAEEIAESFGWVGDSRYRLLLDGWMERRSARLELLDPVKPEATTGTLDERMARFNQLARDEARWLVWNFGAQVAKEINVQVPLLRVDIATRRLIRVDIDGKELSAPELSNH